MNSSRKSCFLNLSKDAKENLQFQYCMKYYENFLKNYSQNFESLWTIVQALGELYFLIKYSCYDFKFGESVESATVFKLFCHNKNKKRSQEFVESSKKLIKWLKKNEHISENIFVCVENEFDVSQLAKDFSQNLKIFSSRKSSNITMKSINNNNIWDDDISMLSISNSGNSLKLNQVNKNLISNYHIILTLKGKKVEGQINGDLNNLIRYINNKMHYENENGSKEKKKYYFRFYIGDRLLTPIEVTNNPDISKICEEDFQKIMDSIKKDNDVIISFCYNPICYFNINNGTYKMGSNKYEQVNFINCSQNNKLLWDIFDRINFDD